MSTAHPAEVWTRFLARCPYCTKPLPVRPGRRVQSHHWTSATGQQSGLMARRHEGAAYDVAASWWEIACSASSLRTGRQRRPSESPQRRRGRSSGSTQSGRRVTMTWGHNSVGRVRRWHRRSREFESPCFHVATRAQSSIDRLVNGTGRSHNAVHRGVAQLGRALALGARCRRFNSCHPDVVSTIVRTIPRSPSPPCHRGERFGTS